MATLKEVKSGNSAKVVRISVQGPLRRRIMDMGITKGCTVFVRKVAPLGDPMEVCVRGYELSLRKSEAEVIEVE
jgi:ferrous iron transport protein A